MNNELTEVLEEGVGELEVVNHKSTAGVVLGIAAVATTLLLVFRKKIAARLENRMVKKLSKKGYTVYQPLAEFNSEEFKDLE